MIRFLYAAVIAGAAFVATASGVQAADRDFCREYTDAALVQVRAALSMPRCAERFDPGPRWSTDRAVHFKWCRGVSRDAANDEREARKDFIERCRRW
ncbi:MAG: hypothetical protein ACLQUZ_18950 [Rhizomicrobium sp.]